MKLTRKQSKNILMSTIGSPFIGMYNERQRSCSYYDVRNDCYCSVGILMEEDIPRFRSNGRDVEEFLIDGVFVAGMVVPSLAGVQKKEMDKALAEMSKLTGLTKEELIKLQDLHDSALVETKNKQHYVKAYEKFVASL